MRSTLPISVRAPSRISFQSSASLKLLPPASCSLSQARYPSRTLGQAAAKGKNSLSARPSSRVARAAAWLDDASRLLDQSAESFVEAVKDRDLAIFYLFLAIQECIDLSAHWVADRLRLAAGLRNRIAHGYAMLDYRRVQTEAQAGIPALRRFLAAVARDAGL